MLTDSSSPNLLLQITLCKTGHLGVSRMPIVPSQMTFTELHEAIAVAFGWDMEPCTAWLFNMVDGDPLAVTEHDDPKRLESTFAAYWRSPGRTYGMSPVELMSGIHIPIGLHMKKVKNQKHWTYDYNVSIHPHAIEVITYLKDYQTPKNN